MFRNRHLNFGYLSVIVVAFVIAISASCKLASAEAGKEEVTNHKLIIMLDGETGRVDVTDEGGNKIDAEKYKPLVGDYVKTIRHAVVYTSGQNSCIIFVIGGERYKYCW